MTIPQLRDYQEEARTAIAAGFFDMKARRQLVVLPTGCGKTVVFAQIKRHPDVAGWLEGFSDGQRKMLVIAHREELLLQAAEKIHAANPDLIVDIEQADQRASALAHVVVASIQTLEKRLDRFTPQQFRIVVIDEAHHCAARTYFKVLDYFGICQSPFIDRTNLNMAEFVPDQTKLFVGFTATPKRGDSVGLEQVFERVAYAKDLLWMVDHGYLCRLRGFHVSTKTDLSNVSIRRGEFVQDELADAVNTPERNGAIVKAWGEHCPDRKSIGFTVDVQHAKDLAAAYRQAGVAAEAISGELHRDDRRDLLRRFRAGEIQVLTNCALLTEGFDEPDVACIIQARPTKSSLLYIQQTGRGTRLAPGKTDCIILDCADQSSRHSLISAADLAGLPAGFDAQGKDLLQVRKRLDELEEERPGLSLANVKNWREVSIAVREFDPYMKRELPQAFVKRAKLTWTPAADGVSFRMRYPIGEDEHQRKVYETVELRQNQLEQWEIAINTTVMPVAFRKLDHGIDAAEAWVRQHHPDAIGMLFEKARWKGDPATDNQIAALRRRRVPFDPDTLTKGEASRLLNIAGEQRRRFSH